MASFYPPLAKRGESLGSELGVHNSSELLQGKGKLSAGRYGIRTGKPKGGMRRSPTPTPPRRRPYRKHRNGRSVIPAERLPQAPRWIASLLPAFILTTLEVLSLLTQGGRVPVSIAALAAARGRAPSTVRNHLRFLRMALIICVVEHPEEHNYNGPNSFIFLTLDPSKDIHIFQNCRGEQFVFKASSIHTLLREKLSINGEVKAKASEFRRKWEESHAENHPKWFKNDWWQRRKERRKKNHRPEVRQKYKEQGEAWYRVDVWRKAHPHREYRRPFNPPKSEKQRQWEAEEAARRAAMTEQQRREEDEEMERYATEFQRREGTRAAERQARAAKQATRYRRETAPACERCGDYGRVQRGRAFVDCPSCRVGGATRDED